MVARHRNELLSVQALPEDVVKNGREHVTSDELTSTSNKNGPRPSVSNLSIMSEGKRMTTPWRERLSSWRWKTSIIVNLGFINTLIMRNAFNIALVCMTGANPTTDTNVSFSANTSIANGEFDWDAETQGIILSAVMYLSFAAPAVTGLLARRFGAKRVVFIGIGMSTVCHMLMPIGARLHVYVLVGLRVLLGCFSGQIAVATTEMWQSWAPSFEKVQLVAFATSGINIGSFLASYLGFMCTIPIDNGWPFLFYVSGVFSIIWLVLWVIFIYDEPAQHPWISEKETYFISKHVSQKKNKNRKIPWRGMATSLPLWSYIIAQTCHMWASSVFFVFLPKYMRDVLKFPIEQNAVLSSLPYASRFLGVLFWSFVSETLRKRTKLSVTANRKLVQALGFLSCSAITICIGFATREFREVSVFLFMAAMFFQSASFASTLITPIDIAPSHASIIVGGFVGAGAFVSLTAPMVVSYLTPNGTIEEWRNVFYVVATTYAFSVVFFATFGSGEVQSWAKDTSDDIGPDHHTTNVPDTSNVNDTLTSSQNNENSAIQIETVQPCSGVRVRKNSELYRIKDKRVHVNVGIIKIDGEVKTCYIPTQESEITPHICECAIGISNEAFEDDSEQMDETQVKTEQNGVNVIYSTKL